MPTREIDVYCTVLGLGPKGKMRASFNKRKALPPVIEVKGQCAHVDMIYDEVNEGTIKSRCLNNAASGWLCDTHSEQLHLKMIPKRTTKPVAKNPDNDLVNQIIAHDTRMIAAGRRVKAYGITYSEKA